jgi:tRNA A37 threonylcarbamoyladenosine dehydratase
MTPAPEQIPETGTSPNAGKKRAPASISFVPSVAGLILAGEVIKDLTGIRGNGIGG